MPKKTPAPKAATGNVPTKPATVTQLPGTKPAPAKKRKILDLERMELDYRTGKLTTRELGALHGVTHGRVSQLAKQHGWVQDLSSKARAQARAMVADPAKRAALTMRLDAAVKTEAEEMAHVKLAHRELIATGRQALRNLLDEVITQGSSDMQATLERALDEIAAGQRAGNLEMAPTIYANLVQAVNRATGTGGRSAIIKNIAMAAEKLLGLERTALDLDDPERNKPPEIPPDRSLSPADHYRWLAGIRSAA